MDIREIDQALAVTGQVQAEDIAAIARAGYRAIVCNRPDGEAADQPLFAELERVAGEHGLQARYLPAETRQMSDEQARQFGRLLAELPKPVLAFCRTGMRSVTMWALSEAGTRPLPELLERAAAAGYNLAGVVRRVAAAGPTPLDAPMP